MKVRSLLFSALCALAVCVSFASCDDDDENKWNDDGSKVELPHSRAFILNQGSWNANNAGIAFYAPNGDADFQSDIYKLQNGKGLGDNAQCMIEYDDCIYVAVNGSNYLAKLNASGVEEQRVSFVDDADLAAGIRYLVAEDGYIYATFYNGCLVKINAKTLVVDNKLTNLGANLEGIAECDDVLYIANSYRQESNGSMTYLTNLIKVDLKTFTKIGEIEVDINPNLLLEEDGKLALISKGNYADKLASLQVIDPRTNKVERLGTASFMCAGNDMLYYIDSQTQDFKHYTHNFYQYNLKTGAKQQIQLSAALPTYSCMMMEMDEDRNELYIGFSDYISTGDIYRVQANGSLIEKFDCGGLNPFDAVFFN